MKWLFFSHESRCLVFMHSFPVHCMQLKKSSSIRQRLHILPYSILAEFRHSWRFPSLKYPVQIFSPISMLMLAPRSPNLLPSEKARKGSKLPPSDFHEYLTICIKSPFLGLFLEAYCHHDCQMSIAKFQEKPNLPPKPGMLLICGCSTNKAGHHSDHLLSSRN